MTAEDKTQAPTNPVLKKLLERSIPVARAEFHSAVNNADGTPENYFSSDSIHKSRHVAMWWVNGDGLLCSHKDKWFMVPSATCRYVYFLSDNR